MTRYDCLTYQGITQPVVEWALDYGIPSALILTRLKSGASVERAITKPMTAKPGDKLDNDAFYGRRGRVSNYQASKGTGAGSVAQEIPEIDFSQDAS